RPLRLGQERAKLHLLHSHRILRSKPTPPPRRIDAEQGRYVGHEVHADGRVAGGAPARRRAALLGMQTDRALRRAELWMSRLRKGPAGVSLRIFLEFQLGDGEPCRHTT